MNDEYEHLPEFKNPNTERQMQLCRQQQPQPQSPPLRRKDAKTNKAQKVPEPGLMLTDAILNMYSRIPPLLVLRLLRPGIPPQSHINLSDLITMAQQVTIVTDETKMWTQLGQKVCDLTKGFVPSHDSLLKMDGMELASCLLASHVNEKELDPDKGCALLVVRSKPEILSIPEMAAPSVFKMPLPPPPAKEICKPKAKSN